jgi:hypothetical protein
LLLLLCIVFVSIIGRVVHEEALSAVTSAPELPHNKTRWFQKNDSRVDFDFTLEKDFSLARAHKKLDSLLLL